MSRIFTTGSLRYILGREANLVERNRSCYRKFPLQFCFYGDHSANRYAATLKQLGIGQGVKVLRIGTGTADSHDNFVKLQDPQKTISILKERLPYVVSIEAEGADAVETILASIELKVPIIVAKHHLNDKKAQDKIAAALSNQSMSRLIGPGCSSFVIPPAGVELASDLGQNCTNGRIGIIAIEKSAHEVIKATSRKDQGHAAVFELGSRQGGTYAWELLQWMLSDSTSAEAICLLTKSADTEIAGVYESYVKAAPENEHLKKVFAIVGQDAKIWEDAGIQVVKDEQELVRLLAGELERIDKKKKETAAVTGGHDISITDIPPDTKRN